MSTPTIDRVAEKPELKDRDTSKDDELFHYVRKAKIAESAVLGNVVIALCGETFPVTKVPKSGSAVCKKCEELYKRLPKGKD